MTTSRDKIAYQVFKLTQETQHKDEIKNNLPTFSL